MRSILCIILLCTAAFPQIQFSVSSVSFPLTVINRTDSAMITVTNMGNKPMSLKVVKPANISFFVKDTSFSLNSGISKSLKIYYQPRQNISENGAFVLINTENTKAWVLPISGSGSTGDAYQSYTYNLSDSLLFLALSSAVQNHRSLGYNTARDTMFGLIDKLPGDTIECVYTGRKIKAANRTLAQSQAFNTEHTWPQSTFSENEPMRSDLNHLFPTDETANGKRSNYPFDKVVTQTWSVGGSILGNSPTGRIVFEPRDIHKGNVARGMIYFITRYPNNYGTYYDLEQDAIYRKWNLLDPVDEKERIRNNAVAVYQLKRNPYIDHPEFVERIYDFIGKRNRPAAPLFSYFPANPAFDSTKPNDSSYLPIALLNNGNAELRITGISSTQNSISFSNTVQTIQPGTSGTVIVIFKPMVEMSITDSLTIQTNIGTKRIPFTAIASNSVGTERSRNLLPDALEVEQNYPNPFNGQTTIAFTLPTAGLTSITLFDITGSKVKSLLSRELAPGRHTFTFDLGELNSGVYIYRIQAGNSTLARTMTLLK